MKKRLTIAAIIICLFAMKASSQSLVATGTAPFVRTATSSKHSVANGGSGWVNTGALDCLTECHYPNGRKLQMLDKIASLANGNPK